MFLFSVEGRIPNFAKRFRVSSNLIYASLTLTLIACGGKSDGDKGGSQTVTDLCTRICEKTAVLNCPKDENCVSSCQVEAASYTGCENESEAILTCGDKRPVSDYYCDTDGTSAAKDGVCSEEFDALLSCVLGGSNSNRDAGTTSNPPPIVGPAISSAPATWKRPSDCGGIGDSCVGLAGCGDQSLCQTVGDVCIPDLASGTNSFPPKSADHPYCAAYTCMTFQEASCFCTGEGGMSTSGCESPSALAGLCQLKGRSCATDPCCDGLSCVDDGSGGRICDQTCKSDTDCDTGCCTDTRDLGYKVCADQSACDDPCKKTGEACTPGTATMANDCCRGSCLESDNPDWAGCRPRCTTDEDCPSTGCCVPFSNSSGGFCADAVYCTCGEVDAPCGQQGQAQCCDGTVCAGTSSDTLTCNQICTSNTDCATDCCSPLASGDSSICLGPEYCQ